MSKPLLLLPLCGALLLTNASCKKPNRSDATSSEKQAKIDACSLLKAEDIPDGAMKTTQPSEHTDGRIRVSQCYFATDPTHRSISLSVTQADPASSDSKTAREFWQQTFGALKNKKDDKKNEGDEEKRESLREQARGGEEKERGPEPQRVDGVGDEAYWVGSRVGGALYVLKKNIFVRISLGGPDEPQVKIDKSKKVAQKALERL
ncbi:MAG: hypothetical protein ABI795_04045 [Chthoniobacterales bacterium]